MRLRFEHRSPNGERGRRELDQLRERWELIFFCWRWFVILIPATAQSAATVVAIVEGRPPSFFFNPF